MPTPDTKVYALTVFTQGGVNDGLFLKDCKAAVAKVHKISRDDVNITVHSTDTLTAGDQTALDGVKDGHVSTTLPNYKTKKDKTVNGKTRQLIGAGFTHLTKTFSLSAESQLKIMGVFVARNEVWLTYPIVWNNIDDTDTLSLADAAAVEAFFEDATVALRSPLDTGTTLKISVTAAADHAAVDAVNDTR